MTKLIVAFRNSANAPENNATQWIEYVWQNLYVFPPTGVASVKGLYLSYESQMHSLE